MIRIAINGFGRIGRCVLRAWVENRDLQKKLDIVHINSPASVESAAHLLKYDSVHGVYPDVVEASDGGLRIGSHMIKYTQHRQLNALSWDEVDIVFECSGRFKSRADLNTHIQQGAHGVMLSSPGQEVDRTIVFGVNEQQITQSDRMISSASCTTNCLAPILKMTHDAFGIVSGFMTTTHAMTGDQRLIDSTHNDLCRARSASQSIIPTKTGAASSIGLVIPDLAGKIQGMALRVPTVNVSMLDLTLKLKQAVSVECLNDMFKDEALKLPNNMVACNSLPLVSTDFNHRFESAIIDLRQTCVQEDLVKIMAWYDNEWGFAHRMLDLAEYWGEKVGITAATN
tara:strand:+ start:2682 stop:3704 length:1023 start_codon:yes stop_codon:yes gene_type:complete